MGHYHVVVEHRQWNRELCRRVHERTGTLGHDKGRRLHVHD